MGFFVDLYDEPLSNLDPKLRHRSRRHITEIHRSKRKPSLYVTHDQGEALAMGDRIGVTAKGRLQQVGTPEELLDAPANLFVAGFMGSLPMNLISGRLTGDADGYRVEAEGVRIPLTAAWKPILGDYGTRDVILGVRPDGLILGSSGNAAGCIGAEVEDVEALIGETSAEFRLAGGERLVGLFADGADDLLVGQRVEIGVQADRIELFDLGTEQSLRTG